MPFSNGSPALSAVAYRRNAGVSPKYRRLAGSSASSHARGNRQRSSVAARPVPAIQIQTGKEKAGSGSPRLFVRLSVGLSVPILKRSSLELMIRQGDQGVQGEGFAP